MTPIILAFTCLGKTVLIPLINISYIEEIKKGCRVVLDDERQFEVKETVAQIAAALEGMDILRRPANIT